MATLIAVYNSRGCVGRCDARCYEAVHPHCECICGGLNHGAGMQQAVANTRTLAQEWINEYTRQRKLEDWWAEIPALEPVQLPLPLEVN